MKLEDLEKVLKSHPAIEFKELPEEEPGKLDRYREFTVRGVEYRIQWWVNICYLYIGEVKIPFYKVEVSGTWPNNFKLNLQFSYMRAVCVILPLEE